MNSGGEKQGVMRIMEVDGKKGYMFYTASMDNVYTAENGATLALDGVCKATYTVGDKVINGYYTTRSSVFGGMIVDHFIFDRDIKRRVCVISEKLDVIVDFVLHDLHS